MKQLNRPERGIISLVTAIMVSLLLILIALGLIGLMIGNTQQSSDDQLAQRAFDSAEGGVEWAYWWLRNNPGSNYGNCSGAASIFNQADIIAGRPLYVKDLGINPNTTQNQLTCVLVTQNSTTQQGVLDNAAHDSDEIRLDPTGVLNSSIREVEVQWDALADGVPNVTGGTWTNGGNNLTNITAAHPSNAPALELTVINYPINGGNVTPSQIKVRNIVFLPSFGGGGGPWSPIYTESKNVVRCNTGGFYQCTGTVFIKGGGGGGPNRWNNANDATIIVVRGRLLHSGQNVHYQLRFRDRTGTLVTLPNSSSIDVTARAGNVYRRIVATVPGSSGSAPPALNYVLYGDQDICKTIDLAGGGVNTCPR